MDNRQIRIFISSTFNDLNDERDYLVNNIFKVLSKKASSRDVSIIPLDLRWGITAEEAKQSKVVKICLDEIKRTRPFFIGIIGERYGWCPTVSEIGNESELKEQYEWVLDAVSRKLSITEIEIQYGVLKNPAPMEAFFYIKDPQKLQVPYDDKLENLRQTIINNRRYPVKYFSQKEDLGKMIEQDFLSVLDKLYPKPVSEKEYEQLEQSSVQHSLKSNYIPIPGLYDELDAFCSQDQCNLLAIKSPSGMGKSALIANWLSESPVAKNMKTVMYFTTSTYTTGEHILNHIISQLCTDSNMASLEMTTPQKTLIKIMEETDEPLLIVIDGLNQVYEEKGLRLSWLPEPIGRTKMIVTATEASSALEVLEIRQAQIIEINTLPVEVRQSILVEYFGERAKKMNQQQISRIIECPLCNNTHLLKTMLSQLTDFGHFELLDVEIERYVNSSSPQDFYQQFLISMEKNYGKELVDSVFSLIALSRHGLSEQELSDIIGFRKLDWVQLYAAMTNHVCVANSLISFNHDTIRQAVTIRYLSKPGQQVLRRRQIIKYFMPQAFSHRKIDELSWQYAQDRAYDDLYHMLLDLRTEEYLYEKDLYELGQYWRMLISSNPKRYSFEKVINSDVPSDFDEDRVGKLYGDLAIFSHIVMSMHEPAIMLAKKGMSFRCSKTLWQCSFYYLLTGLCQESGRSDDAVIFCKAGLESCQRILGESYETNKFRARLALLLNMRHEWKDAEKEYLEVLEYWDSIGAVDADEKANVLNELGEMYGQMYLPDQSALYLNQALKIRLKLHGEKNTMTANSYNTIGRIYEDAGDMEKALEMFKKSLGIRMELYGENHPDTLTCMSNVVRVLIATKRIEEANVLNTKLLESNIGILGSRHMNVGTNYHNKGWAELESGNYEKAVHDLFQALDIFTENKGPHNPERAACLKNIAQVYYRMNNFCKAIEYINLSLETYINCFGKDSKEVAESYYARSFILSEMGEYDKAISDNYTCLRIINENDYSNYKIKGDALYGLADDYRNLMQYDYALEFAQKSSDFYEKLLGEDNQCHINSQIEIMDIYYDMGEFQRCIDKATQILNYLQSIGRVMDEDMGRCLYQIAGSYGEMGQFEKALPYAKENLKVRNNSNSEDILAISRANYQIAYLYINLKEYAKAEPYCKQAVQLDKKAGDSGKKQLSHSNNIMGVLYYNQKRYEDAVPYYRQTLSWREENLNEKDNKLSAIRKNLAYALMGMDNYAEAFDLLWKVLECLQQDDYTDEKEICSIIRNLAECVDCQDLGVTKTSQIVDYLLKYNINISRTAQLCKKLAFHYHGEKQYQKAMDYWKKEAKIRVEDLQEVSENTAWALSNIGVMLRNSKQNEEAVSFFARSRDCWVEIQGKEGEMVKKLTTEINKIMAL